MASITKRNNKYAVRYDYKDENGKRRQKWEEFDSKSEAMKFKNKLESKKLNDDFINPSGVKIKDFLHEWLRIHAQSNWQHKTYLSSQSLIDIHVIPVIGEIELQKITSKQIEEFITKLRFKKISKKGITDETTTKYLSTTTIGHIYTLLKSAFDKAIEWKLISENPVMCKKPPRAKVETTIWDIEDVRAALEDIEHEQLHLAVHLAFICSLRIGEVLGLSWDCVNFKDLSIHIDKTLQRVTKESIELLPRDNLYQMISPRTADSKSILILKTPKTSSSNRTIYISKELRDELLLRKQQIEKDKQYHDSKYVDYNLVFSIEDGYPVEPKLCEKWFKKWQNTTECDLPKIIFHELRHSSTTYKLSLTGGDIKSVQGDTGHATADMVMNRYSHIQDKARRRMMDLLENDFYSEESVIEISEDEMEMIMSLVQKNPGMKDKIMAELNTKDTLE